MLNRPGSQDAKLPAIVLLRGMWAPIALNVHRSMSMVAIERMRALEGMSIRILKSKVLVKHRIGVFETRKVKAGLGCKRMMP